MIEKSIFWMPTRMTCIDKPSPPRADIFMRDGAVPWRTLGAMLGYVVYAWNGENI